MRRAALIAVVVMAAIMNGSSAVVAQSSCFGPSCQASPVPISNGGTGATTASQAVNALGGATSTGSGGLVRSTGPGLNQNGSGVSVYLTTIRGGTSSQSISESVEISPAAGYSSFKVPYGVSTNGAKNSTVRVINQPEPSATSTAGFGSGLVFSGSTTIGVRDNDMARISGVWTDATHATRSAAITFDTVDQAGALTERARIHAAGGFQLAPITFAVLGTPGNGTIAYCSDCTIANPCAGAGTGALAKRLNGVWVCN